MDPDAQVEADWVDPDAGVPVGGRRTPPEPEPPPVPVVEEQPDETTAEAEEAAEPVEPLVWTRVLGPLGPVLLTSDTEALTGVFVGPHDEALERCRRDGRRHAAHPVLSAAAAQLAEYLGGERKGFDLPVVLRGTPTRMAVWSAVREVPYGEVVTAGELAGRVAVEPVAGRAAVRAERETGQLGFEFEVQRVGRERVPSTRVTAAAVGSAVGRVEVPVVVPVHRVVRGDGSPMSALARRLLDLERGTLFTAW